MTELIKSKIRTIPHWPKQGVMFRDITTLLKDRDGFQSIIRAFAERYRNEHIDVVAGIESRGFIIGGAVADHLNVGFVPIRKKGKLPAATESETYELEYGTDTLEIHRDALSPGHRVLIIDDLIATGGTAAASCRLIEKCGGIVAGVAFIVNLPELKGLQKLQKYNPFYLVEFEGE